MYFIEQYIDQWYFVVGTYLGRVRLSNKGINAKDFKTEDKAQAFLKKVKSLDPSGEFRIRSSR
jgi:hypothetical protein